MVTQELNEVYFVLDELHRVRRGLPQIIFTGDIIGVYKYLNTRHHEFADLTIRCRSNFDFIPARVWHLEARRSIVEALVSFAHNGFEPVKIADSIMELF